MSSTIAGGHRKPGLIQALALLLPCTMVVMGSVVLQPDQGLLRAHFANVPNNEYWVPFLLTVPAIFATLFTLPAGYLADVMGRRPPLIIAMLIYTAAGVAPFFLKNLIPIAVSRILVGMCEGVVITITTALIGDYFNGHMRDRLMGWQSATATIAATILIPVSGFLSAAIGWNGPFLIYSITGLWLVGILVFTWEPKPDEHAGEVAGGVSWAGFPWARVAEICAVTLLGSYFFYAVQLELPNALPKFGIVNPAVIGQMAGIASLGMVAGAVSFQFVVKRSLGTLLLGELALIAASFIAMGFAAHPQILIGAAFVNQVGCGMMLPTLLTTSMRFLPFEHRGRGVGFWQGAFALGQFVVGMSFPAIKNMLGGDYAHALLAVGIVACIATLVALVMAIRTHGRIAPAS